MRQLRHIVVAVAFLVVGACASASTGQGVSRGSRDVIVRSEFEGTDFANAHDAVRRLRPAWLQQRGLSTTNNPAGSRRAVFIDNVRAGDLTRLESIPIEMVEEIRFFSASDATTKWGTNVTGGVVEVILRRAN